MFKDIVYRLVEEVAVLGRDEAVAHHARALVPPQPHNLCVAGWTIYGSSFSGLFFLLRIESQGLRVWGLGFRENGSEFKVECSGFRVQGSGFRV